VKRVDELPSGWAVARIEEILTSLSDGKTIHQGWSPLCEKQACETDDEWGVLKTTAIQPGEFQVQHHKRLPPHLSPRAYSEVFAGDLLLTCAGPRVRCGIPCLVRQTRPRLMLSGKMYRFRPQVGVVDPRFLEAFLLSEETQQIIDGMKTGGNESGLNLTHDRFRQLEFRFPSLPEQTRIVDKLEELLSDLDAGVAELKAAQKKLAQYRESLLKAAVEGGLTAAWREQNVEPKESGAQLLERILRERRASWEAEQLSKFEAQGETPTKRWREKYREPPIPEVGQVNALPSGWFYSTLESLIPSDGTGTKTGPFGSLLKKHEHLANGIPVIGIENIDRMRFVPGSKIHISAAKAEQLQQYSLVTGDVVISRSGTVGEVCVVPENLGEARFSTNIMRVRLNTDVVSPGFFCMLLNGSPSVLSQIRVLCSGSTRDFLNTEILKTLVFPIPSLREQLEIERIIEDAFSDLAAQSRAVSIALRRSAAQRKNILKAAFSGHLVRQDPNDEPASVLLERIRAERAGREKSPKTRKVRGRCQGDCVSDLPRSASPPAEMKNSIQAAQTPAVLPIGCGPQITAVGRRPVAQ
jgi:type I restriction enzyme, S subunit